MIEISYRDLLNCEASGYQSVYYGYQSLYYDLIIVGCRQRLPLNYPLKQKQDEEEKERTNKRERERVKTSDD